jgi:hypothetical protein
MDTLRSLRQQARAVVRQAVNHEISGTQACRCQREATGVFVGGYFDTSVHARRPSADGGRMADPPFPRDIAGFNPGMSQESCGYRVVMPGGVAHVLWGSVGRSRRMGPLRCSDFIRLRAQTNLKLRCKCHERGQTIRRYSCDEMAGVLAGGIACDFTSFDGGSSRDP